ncbi:MAG: hypothetical protein ACI4U2_03395 [Christensenellaceae bacterium]
MGMIFLPIVLSVVYLVSVQVYAFFLVKGQKDRPDERREDYKLFVAGLLGGAVTVYVALFLYRYRLSNPLIMITMPLIGAVNIFVAVLFYRSGIFF